VKKSLGARIAVVPTPVWVVGTYDKDDKPNVATAAWAGVCCSKPPCVAVSFRKATYTHGNIVARQCFTVSVPPERYAREADYFGIASGRDGDKFASTGLTPVRGDVVEAPYVGEFPLAFECKLLHTVEIGLHTQFIGEIGDTKVDESVLTESGLPDVEALQFFAFSPDCSSYHRIGASIGRAFAIGKEI
jgi:flavin reductase (DIM6/NTAB) family NADH-FMN oxidoreductase RutF